MKDLSEKSLEEALIEMWNVTGDRGEILKLTPTHVIMVPYPGETREQFELRCIYAQMMAKALVKP